jgi:hypothetical protein
MSMTLPAIETRLDSDQLSVFSYQLPAANPGGPPISG